MDRKQRQSWRFSLKETQDYVSLPKEPRDGEPAWTLSHKGNPKHMQCLFALRIKDTPFQPSGQKYDAKGLTDKQESYTAALVLEDERIRSIDYNMVRRRYMFSDEIVREKAWHENIRYYSPEAVEIVNEHETLGFEAFYPTDLQSFHLFCCNRWNIELAEDERRLL